MRNTWYAALLVLSLLGLAAGAWGLGDRLANGLGPVAFGSYVPWGLWVAFYLYFLGLSAGAFLVTILTYLLGWKRFASIGPLSAFVVLVALVCEVQFILLDLGYMSRALYQFFLTPSFTSLMTWMFVLFQAMLAIYLLKTYFLVRGGLVRWAADPERRLRPLYRLLCFGTRSYGPAEARRDERRVHALAWVSLPVGLAFYGTNGAFFAILMNRPIWNSALTPLLFIVAALLSGGALVAFLVHLFRPHVPRPMDREGEGLVQDLGRIVLFLLLVFLFLELMQFFVGYQTARTDIVTALNHIVAGPEWWVFWIGHLLLGSLVPLVLLMFSGRKPGVVALACFLVFITFAAVRYNFVIPDLAVYKLDGLEFAFRHARLSTDYIPNLNEWLVSLWVFSFGLLAFLLGTRFLPVVSGSEGGENHVH